VPRIVITPCAEDELAEIWLSIAVDNEAAAEQIVRTIAQKIDRLSDQPRLGPRRPDIRPSARLLVHAPYLILYETHPDTDTGPVDFVEIVSIVDGRRDLSGLL
jgi:toxin ParE1/3/4